MGWVISNGNEWRASLQGELNNLRRLQIKDQADRAERIADRMVRAVHVDSGETRDALGVEKGEQNGKPYFDVGVVHPERLSDRNKPVYEEFGTSKMAKRPFARAAIQPEL